MGHATHFLERLERLSSPQADFALELYRDSALIRFVLERTRLPDGAERVALGVDQRPGGPHLIVARDGGFVTCLGAGMSTHDLPVITRGQIEHLGGQFEGLREAMARSRDRGETRRLFRSVMSKGWALSREEFTALAVMMPILEGACARSATDIGRYVMKFQRGFTRSRYRRMNDKAVAELRHYWASWWAAGHLVALCGTRGPEMGANITSDSQDKAFMTHTLSRMTMYSMSLPVMLRGGWAAARIGREVIPRAKQKMRIASDFIDVVSNAVPLALLALRHRGARAEILKFLARTRRGLEQTMSTPLDQLLSDSLLDGFGTFFEPDGAAAMAAAHHRIGTSLVLSISERLPEGHPYRYGSAEEVPEDLALAFPMCLEADLLHDVVNSLAGLPIVLPWLASAEAVDFYLPAERLEAFSAVWPPWSPDGTLGQLDNLHRYYGRDRPARARSTPGRNEPCPCGSGKKFKRCCGA